MTTPIFSASLPVNLTGTFNTMAPAAPAMATNEPGDDGERGVILTRQSIAAYDGQTPRRRAGS